MILLTWVLALVVLTAVVVLRIGSVARNRRVLRDANTELSRSTNELLQSAGMLNELATMLEGELGRSQLAVGVESRPSYIKYSVPCTALVSRNSRVLAAHHIATRVMTDVVIGELTAAQANEVCARAASGNYMRIKRSRKPEGHGAALLWMCDEDKEWARTVMA